MRNLLLWFTFVIGITMNLFAAQFEPSDEKFIGYVVSIAKSQGASVSEQQMSKNDLAIAQTLDPILWKLSPDQLLDGCRKIDIYSLKVSRLKSIFWLGLRDATLRESEVESFCRAVIDLKKYWTQQVPPSDESLASCGRDMIESLDFAIEAAKQRLSFQVTLASLKKARNSLRLERVEFPYGEMKIVPSARATIDDLLKSSNPQVMPARLSPLQSVGSDDPKRKQMDYLRLKVLENGSIIYIRDGNSVLAGLLFYNSQLMFIQDVKGHMPIALQCAPVKLLKMLHAN